MLVAYYANPTTCATRWCDHGVAARTSKSPRQAFETIGCSADSSNHLTKSPPQPNSSKSGRSGTDTRVVAFTRKSRSSACCSCTWLPTASNPTAVPSFRCIPATRALLVRTAEQAPNSRLTWCNRPSGENVVVLLSYLRAMLAHRTQPFQHLCVSSFPCLSLDCALCEAVAENEHGMTGCDIKTGGKNNRANCLKCA